MYYINLGYCFYIVAMQNVQFVSTRKVIVYFLAFKKQARQTSNVGYMLKKDKIMTIQFSSILSIIFLLITISCKENKKTKTNHAVPIEIDTKNEKEAILKTLNNETKAAFQRNYKDWKDKWVHDPDITKTYIDFTNNTFSESVGWNKISQFVKTFMEEHPEPEPVPKLVDKIDVRLYGKGAWVTYEQKDSLRGLKRETRLMEKVNGEWKIAGMQTTIYGFKTDKK